MSVILMAPGLGRIPEAVPLPPCRKEGRGMVTRRSSKSLHDGAQAALRLTRVRAARTRQARIRPGPTPRSGPDRHDLKAEKREPRRATVIANELTARAGRSARSGRKFRGLPSQPARLGSGRLTAAGTTVSCACREIRPSRMTDHGPLSLPFSLCEQAPARSNSIQSQGPNEGPGQSLVPARAEPDRRARR